MTELESLSVDLHHATMATLVRTAELPSTNLTSAGASAPPPGRAGSASCQLSMLEAWICLLHPTSASMELLWRTGVPPAHVSTEASA